MRTDCTHEAPRRGESEPVRVLDALSADYLRLPRVAMREVGSATQTLAGLRRISLETFIAQEKIAAMAGLPLRTTQRHLKTLTEQGLVENAGRDKRRTVTLRLTPKAAAWFKKPYAQLPRWACFWLDTWAERALFAELVSRHKLWDKTDGFITGHASSRDSIESLMRATGLSRPAVVDAKRSLLDVAIVDEDEAAWDNGKLRPASLYIRDDAIVPFAAIEAARIELKSGGATSKKVAGGELKSGGRPRLRSGGCSDLSTGLSQQDLSQQFLSKNVPAGTPLSPAGRRELYRSVPTFAPALSYPPPPVRMLTEAEAEAAGERLAALMSPEEEAARRDALAAQLRELGR